MSQNLIIAVESSGLSTSVAIGRRSSGHVELLGEQTHVAQRRSTALLLPGIRELLTNAGAVLHEVGLIGFVRGPGSFTGLRAATTIATMLQSVTGCAVVGVDTLEALARGASEHPSRPNRIVPLLDAKRGQVYATSYERSDEGVIAVAPGGLHDAANFFANLMRPCVLLGAGLTQHRDAAIAAGLGDSILDEAYWTPRARIVLQMTAERAERGEFLTPQQIVPIYLRPPECEEVYDQRRAAARARRAEGIKG